MPVRLKIQTTANYVMTCSLLVLWFARFPVYSQAFSADRLDSAVRKFEAVNGKCAVIILDSKSAEIAYCYNRRYAIAKCFPPGSLAKVWSAFVLLEHDRLLCFSPEKKEMCRGRFYPGDYFPLTQKDFSCFNLPLDTQTGKHYFRCSLAAGHGDMDLAKAIIHSCNVYFLTQSAKNPHVFYSKLVNKWHLDSGTGFSKKGTAETIKAAKSITTMQAAASVIGEGGAVMVSPLKVAQVYAAIFENGPLMRPFEKNRGSNAEQFPLHLDPAHRQSVITALRQTVIDGTLGRLSVKNSEVRVLAGKTGSGTHYNRRYKTHAWNVIYFKYRGRRYVLVTFVFRGSGAREGRELSQVVLNAV